MATRRMFSKNITNSGKFLKMPPTSRLLYYDLGMNADDDGYAEWFTVIRMTGSTEQDLKVLQANGFVHVFDENVLIIQDWKENNYIQKDRYTASRYLQSHPMYTECIQNVYKMDTQVRLGKDREGNNSSASDFKYSPSFEEFWKEYPKKVGKGGAFASWKKVKPPKNEILIPLLKKQKKNPRWHEENGRFIPNPQTWLNQRRWEDEVGDNLETVWKM